MNLLKEVESTCSKLSHPFTMIAAGPTGSGKTYLVRDLLSYHLSTMKGIAHSPIKVYWAFGIWQKIYDIPLENVSLKYVEGVPTEEDVEGFDVIVLDDLMSEIKNSKFVIDLFTKGSHHKNLSVILLTQNLYNKGPIVRDLNLNAHYIIMFKSPRDKLQIQCLGRQVYPSHQKYFMSAYEQSTELPHGYLLLDLKQITPDNLRLRTRIVPTSETNFELKPIASIKNV